MRLTFVFILLLSISGLYFSCAEHKTTETSEEDSSELKTFKEECVRYYEAAAYDSLIIRAKPFLESSMERRDINSVIYAGIFIAQAYIMLEERDSTSHYMHIVESAFDSFHVENDQLFSIYYNVQGIYSLKINLDYSYALECFSKTLELRKKNNDTVNVVVSLINIANIYLIKGDVAGMGYAEDAFRLSREESMPDYIKCIVDLLMAQMQFLAGNYSKSEYYLEQGRSLALQNEYLYHYAQIHLLKANICMKKELYEEAMREYSSASEFLDYAEPTTVIQYYLNYGEYCSGVGRYEDAISFIEKGIEVSYIHHNPAMRGSLLRSLSEVYNRMGNYSSSLSYYKKYISFEDSVSKIGREQEFSRLVLDMQSIKHANELNLKDLEVLKANKRILVISGILIIITVALIFSRLLYIRQKKTYKALVAQHQSYMQRQELELVRKKLPENDSRKLYDALEEKMKSECLYRMQDLSLERLAELLGTNRTYLSKAINTYAGMTFSCYINKYRVEDAIRTMSDPGNNVPLKQLAGDVGYNSVYVFTKAFQRETGISPGAYRKELLSSKKNAQTTD